MAFKYCPLCFLKKLMHTLTLTSAKGTPYNNGAALTPPMGWSSWNLFRDKINEDLIKETADAMKKSGLADAGYKFINLDDCWQNSSRDENGRLQADFTAFPSGIKGLNDYVNSLGLKLGIYSSNGTLTCEDYPASLGREDIDADTFAQWGVEYFKYDFCHNVPVPTRAPLIVKAEIGKKYSSDTDTMYASDAELSGTAKLVKDKKVDGGFYIKGLCANSGKAVFRNVNAPEEGKYILTLTIRKEKIRGAFLTAEVNGRERYSMDIPEMKKFTPEHRIQIEIKLDKGENTITLFNPVVSKNDSEFLQYKKMGEALKRATKEYALKNGTEEKPIVYSICEWGRGKPYEWGGEAGNLWRTTPDILPAWTSIMAIYHHNIRLAEYAGPGGWNDPDMLEVGNGRLTYEENKSHFSLWCMMASPLILGNDIRKFIKSDGSADRDSKIYSILTNKNLIAIDQDILGIPAKKYGSFSKNPFVDVLIKPLDKGKAAVCVFNKGIAKTKTGIDIEKIVNLSQINLKKQSTYKITDCWQDKTEKGNVITAETAKHACQVYIVE